MFTVKLYRKNSWGDEVEVASGDAEDMADRWIEGDIPKGDIQALSLFYSRLEDLYGEGEED